MVYSLPLVHWPEQDRLAWTAACQPHIRLRAGGRAGHMKPITQAALERRYGYFLKVLHDADLLDARAPQGSHVTPANIDCFLEAVEDRWSSVTLYSTVHQIRRMAEIVAPREEYGWLKLVERALKAQARSRRRRENVTTDELLSAGEALFREAERAEHLSPPKRAKLARNGFMVALLAIFPMRHKNLHELALGSSIRQEGGVWWVVLESHETKASRVDERPLPSFVQKLLEGYLDRYRPMLLASGNVAHSTSVHQALWVATTGAPLTYSAVGAAIKKTTEQTLGQALSPHAFRRAVKATATLYGGEHPQLAQVALDHHSARVSDEHYDASSNLEASRELSKLVQALRRE